MEVRDLPPGKDPKGGSPRGSSINLPPTEEPKKPKSDQLRHATARDYFKAHSHAELGSEKGFKGFIKSNLFTALVIWILSQAALLGLSYVANYYRTSELTKWSVSVDQTLKRMDEWGTTHGHYADERQDIAISDAQAKIRALSDLQSQIGQLITSASERNNQQDKQIAEVQAQMSQVVPTLAEIKAKLVFVADLLDERTKNKK